MDKTIEFITITDRAGETRVINAPTPEDGGDESSVCANITADDVQTTFQRLLNGVQTDFERDSNEIETLDERDSDDTETSAERQRQTEAATRERENLPAISPRDFCDLYANVVQLLGNKKFIYRVTKRRGLKHKFSVPKKVTEAINQELGTNLKPSMVNKIQFCRLYQKRFSPFAFWSVVVISITILALALWPASPKGIGEKIENQQTSTTVVDCDFDLRAEVEKWQKQHNYYFSGWRLSHDIAGCKVGSVAELGAFLNSQKKIQGSSFNGPQKW